MSASALSSAVTQQWNPTLDGSLPQTAVMQTPSTSGQDQEQRRVSVQEAYEAYQQTSTYTRLQRGQLSLSVGGSSRSFDTGQWNEYWEKFFAAADSSCMPPQPGGGGQQAPTAEPGFDPSLLFRSIDEWQRSNRCVSGEFTFAPCSEPPPPASVAQEQLAAFLWSTALQFGPVESVHTGHSRHHKNRAVSFSVAFTLSKNAFLFYHYCKTVVLPAAAGSQYGAFPGSYKRLTYAPSSQTQINTPHPHSSCGASSSLCLSSPSHELSKDMEPFVSALFGLFVNSGDGCTVTFRPTTADFLVEYSSVQEAAEALHTIQGALFRGFAMSLTYNTLEEVPGGGPEEVR